MSGRSGSQISLQRKVIVGISDEARIEPVGDIMFDSRVAKGSIVDAANELGLEQTMGRSTRIGLIAGLAGAGLAVIVGVAVVVSQLLG